MNLQNAWTHRQISKKQAFGLSIVFIWFFIGGIMHFAATRIEASVVPPYIPWPMAAVLVSGAADRNSSTCRYGRYGCVCRSSLPCYG